MYTTVVLQQLLLFLYIKYHHHTINSITVSNNTVIHLLNNSVYINNTEIQTYI